MTTTAVTTRSVTYRPWTDLTDEEAKRAAATVEALGLEITPSIHRRVHLASDGEVHLAVWHPVPIPAYAQEIDGGESWAGFVEVTGHLHPAAEALAILASPGNPELELARRRAHRAECEARRQAAHAERERRGRAQQAADEERRRCFREAGGREWQELPAPAATLFLVAIGLEDLGGEADIRLAKVFRAVADQLAQPRVGDRDARPHYPGREWRTNPPAAWSSLVSVPQTVPASPAAPAPAHRPLTLDQQVTAKQAEYRTCLEDVTQAPRRDDVGRELLALEAQQQRERLRSGTSV